MADAGEELSHCERVRLENLALLQSLMGITEQELNLKESLEEISKLAPKAKKRKARSPSRNANKDEPFVFHGQIPRERKRSARLANLCPEYTEVDLIGKSEYAANLEEETEDIEDNVEYAIYTPRYKRSTLRATKVPSMPVEDVSVAYINNISYGQKTWSTSGSSCHQCRQKTLDSKTFCRSGRCIGVRGQFCGPCLRHRYGELVRIVLKNPSWKCPPCRGICNCSICRTREGKRPTGMLPAMALQQDEHTEEDLAVSSSGPKIRNHIKDDDDDDVSNNNATFQTESNKSDYLKISQSIFVKSRAAIKTERDDGESLSTSLHKLAVKSEEYFPGDEIFGKSAIKSKKKIKTKLTDYFKTNENIGRNDIGDFIQKSSNQSEDFYLLGFLNESGDFKTVLASTDNLGGDVLGFDECYTYFST